MEFAAVHRDDTDDDDDDDDDDPSSDEPDIDFLFDYTEGGNDSSEFEGWEDTLGASVFPQENTQASEESTHISEYALERASDDVEDSFPLTAIDDLEEDEEDYWSEVVQEDEGDEEEEDDDTRGDLEDGNSNNFTTQDQSTSTLDILASDIAAETSQETNPLPSSTSSNPFSCPLCLDPPRACSATRCGHVFCTQFVFLLIVICLCL